METTKIIQIDSREHEYKNSHITAYFDEHGIQWVKSKMLVGDYTYLTNQKVCIDRKKDVVEIAGNICGDQHERFRAEVQKAQLYGIKLIVLIEENANLDTWTSPRRRNGTPITHVSGRTLKKAMATMSERYGVEFRFCKKNDTAKTILDILDKENNNNE